MDTTTLQWVTVAAALLVTVWLRSIVKWRRRSHGRPLPPGPTPLPLIGNMLDVPSFKPWVAYRELAAKYGK